MLRTVSVARDPCSLTLESLRQITCINHASMETSIWQTMLIPICINNRRHFNCPNSTSYIRKYYLDGTSLTHLLDHLLASSPSIAPQYIMSLPNPTDAEARRLYRLELHVRTIKLKSMIICTFSEILLSYLPSGGPTSSHLTDLDYSPSPLHVRFYIHATVSHYAYLRYRLLDPE
jgi:hypothetical protein